MVLALLTSKSSSRTRRTSSRISALVSLISLSAFAVAALDAFLRRFSWFLGSHGTSRGYSERVRRSRSALHSALLRCIGSSATYLFIEGGGTVSGPTTRKTPTAVRQRREAPPTTLKGARGATKGRGNPCGRY